MHHHGNVGTALVAGAFPAVIGAVVVKVDDHRVIGEPKRVESILHRTYDVIHDAGSAPIKLWTRGVPLEDEARRQLRNIARLPFIHRHIAVMPDVHLGKGATVGSVVPTIGAMARPHRAT